MTSLFEKFCEGFGDPRDVRQEIIEYWKAGGSLHPSAVYERLVDKRVWDKEISLERANFLKALFADSFMPDAVTGYIPKHRDPLITAFADEYAAAGGLQPIYRVGADVINLRGLNDAIIKSLPSGDHRERRAKEIANRVIRVMTEILSEHLETLGEIIPIRRGGDELSVYVRPTGNPLADKQAIEDKLQKAQQEIAAFACEAGLRDLIHSKAKEGKEPGVGLGCAAENLVDENGVKRAAVQMNMRLEAGIDKAKKDYRILLGSKNGNLDEEVDIEKLNGVIAVTRARVKESSRAETSPLLRTLFEDRKFDGKNPEYALHDRVTRCFPNGTKESYAEKRLLVKTIELTDHKDYVTDLPLFSEIDRVMVPNFKANYGGLARVVHFDFNNLSGPNELGSWVGDRVAALFAECVKGAMKDLGPPLSDTFIHYLSSQGGGKFTLLVPAPNNKGAQVGQHRFIQTLTAHIEKQLEKRSKESLDLSPEEKSATQEIIRRLQKNEEDGPKLREFERPEDRGRHRRQMGDNDEITLKRINNPRSRRMGSHVVSLSPIVDLNQTNIKDVVALLEAKALQGQVAIEGFDHRKAERNRAGHYKRLGRVTEGGALLPEIPARTVEEASLGGTLKLAPHEQSVTR